MMRVLEVVVILVIIAVTVGILFGKRERRLNALLCMSLVLVVLLHGIIDHFRIQMVPAYAAVLMLIIVLVIRLAKPQSKVRTKRLLKNSLLTVVVIRCHFFGRSGFSFLYRIFCG
ncbi:hypothetical protein [Paenibacillus sp. NRS-1760]|uniref:hypothetical protein n=1 Tax=Paenibacillus sp. NRS-1760 TaxID=3233902 RepID=UPI003D2D3E2E